MAKVGRLLLVAAIGILFSFAIASAAYAEAPVADRSVAAAQVDSDTGGDTDVDVPAEPATDAGDDGGTEGGGGDTAPAPVADWLVATLVGIVAALILLTLAWILLDRHLGRKSATKLTLAGVSVSIIDTGFQRLAMKGEADQAGLQVSGPSLITVGSKGEYKATNASGEPVDATWSIEPGDGADVPSGETATAEITAKRVGVFKLTAKSGDIEAPPLTVEMVTASQSAQVALVGKGWGTIVMGGLAVIVVLVMGLTNRMDQGAIAALVTGLLALAGYTATQKPGGNGENDS